jgi:hypothetical protein
MRYRDGLVRDLSNEMTCPHRAYGTHRTYGTALTL